MKELLYTILGAVLIVGSVYLLGRIFWKAGLHELDYFLGKKFVDYITKKEEDGNKKEK